MVDHDKLEQTHSKDNPHKLKTLPKCSQCGRFEIVPALGRQNLCQMCGSIELDSKYQLKPYLYSKMLGMKPALYVSGQQIFELEKKGFRKEHIINNRFILFDLFLNDFSHYLLIYDAYLNQRGHKIIYKETLR